MAHQNGTANDPVDLLDKLRVFAQANGWTIHNFGARPAGATAGQALQLSKSGLAASFLSLSAVGTVTDPGPKVGGYVHDAYVGGSGTENQANGSDKAYTNAMAGPYLYVVVETAAGLFKHFGIGVLDGMGVLNSGAFMFNSNWNYNTFYVGSMFATAHMIPWLGNEGTLTNGYSNSVASSGITIRADSDTLAPKWYLAVNHAGSGNTYVPRRLRGGPGYANRTVQVLNYPILSGASMRTGRTTLVPTLMLGERTGGQYSPLGSGPGVRWVQLDYLDPGAVLTIGTDQWKVFPVVRKNGSAGQPNSLLHGFAYKMN